MHHGNNLISRHSDRPQRSNRSSRPDVSGKSNPEQSQARTPTSQRYPPWAPSKGALSSLQTAAKGPHPGNRAERSGLFRVQGRLADSTIATASATSARGRSGYSLEVSALATNQRLALGRTYDASAAVLDFGSDTQPDLTITRGGTAVDITLDTSQNTLAGVRDAINRPPPARVTIITDASGGQNLLLTATDGGTANAVSVSGTAAFIDPGQPVQADRGPSAFSQTQAAPMRR